MRGHILVGGQLIELGLWDEALPHFLHPTEELYGLMEKYIKLHNIRPFRRELQALAQAVKAKRKGAYEQALKVVRPAARRRARRGQEVHDAAAQLHRRSSAVEVLRWRSREYEASIEDGRFAKPVEYQDSRGFVWQAERMIEGAAAELAAHRQARPSPRSAPRSPSSRRRGRRRCRRDAPVLEVGEMSALISDIELHTSRY